MEANIEKASDERAGGDKERYHLDLPRALQFWKD